MPDIVKPRKGFATILVLGLILAVFILFGVYFLNLKTLPNQNNNVRTLTPATQATSTPTASSTPDKTTNWKTYSDAANGVSFKYPESFQITYQTNNEIDWNPPGYLFTMVLKVQDKPFEDLKENTKIRLSNEPRTNEITINKFYENLIVDVGGKNISRQTFSCNTMDCYFHLLSFENHGKYYWLIYDGAGGGRLQTFNLIQNSLKLSN